MRNRVLSLLVSVALLFGVIQPVFAVGGNSPEQAAPQVTISTAEELISFAESCRLDQYSVGLTVALQNDIDLTGTEFFSIPVFSGTFLGNGYTIFGLSLTADGSVQGLFRYLTATAVVQQLNVQGNVQPDGSHNQVGGIAGSNAGTIRNCSFSGAVSGGSRVGGIVGFNDVTGTVVDCTVSGQVVGNHFVGGVAGENQGVIRNCVNTAVLNNDSKQNSVELSDITLDDLSGTEAANTVTDVGGIAGRSTGVIRSCRNTGEVGYKQMGYNVGGIAGRQSGYIVDCINTATVHGRKEVGGIVGHMEPAAKMEYSTDTLQILRGQLDQLSRLVDRVSANSINSTRRVAALVAQLEDQLLAAGSALRALEWGNKPDADSNQAAANAASAALAAMGGTLTSIAAELESSVTTQTRDLKAIADQIAAMEKTLNGASDNLGGSFRDVSDQDKEEDLTGKVENCVNTGAVMGDLNVGGIAGAVAVESDLEVLEDWEVHGNESLNFSAELRAVVLNCENSGTVAGHKQNVGGIVGWQSMGLVKQCANTSVVDAAAAQYVGGISGQSTGFLRECQVQCRISGADYVGGIAGSATVVTDCRTMVEITDASERSGAVLGFAQQDQSGEEEPIRGNYYLAVAKDLGAVDGISYVGKAEPLAADAFFELPQLHEMFRTVTLTFRCEDGTEYQVNTAPGSAVAAEKIPAVPSKEGYLGKWEGLEELDLSCVLYNASFNAVYTVRRTVLVSDVTRENGLAVLLVQGDFGTEEPVTLTAANTAQLTLQDGENVVESWAVAVPEAENAVKARLHLPETISVRNVKLMVQGTDGVWSEREFTVDESYIVFGWSSADAQIALVTSPAFPLVFVVAAAAVVLVGSLVLFRRKVRRKKATVGTEE